MSTSILRIRSRFLLGCCGIAAVMALLPACNFKPRIPDAVLTCADDQHCPQGFYCELKLGRCCRNGACEDLPGTGRAGPAPSRADAGTRPTDTGAATVEAGGSDLAGDAAAAVPPGGESSDAGADPNARDGGTDAAAAVMCSGTSPVPAAEPGRQSFCTIVAGDNEVTLSIHTMVPGDAASTRTYGACSASLPLGHEASDPATKAGRPLSNPTVDALIDLVEAFKRSCAEHQARVVGAAANQWARQASNWSEIQQKVRDRTGVDLDLPSPTEELAQLYFGVTRNRRGRAVIMPGGLSPEIVYWTSGAPLMTRVPLRLSSTEVNDLYLGEVAPSSFEAARRALKARLQDNLGPQLTTLRRLVQERTVEAGFIVGPTDATVPLALMGELRDGQGTWSPAALFRKKRDEAAVTPSPYGRIFGPAPITPVQLDGFFATVDNAQWGQLRHDPIRSAYGGELLYVTTLLDLLGDETKASEFAFVFANAHLGFLFAKLLPPPG